VTQRPAPLQSGDSLRGRTTEDAAQPGSRPPGGGDVGLYVHVPFCASRCGYCDFNTYTSTELGDSVRRESFAEVLVQELAYARESLGPRSVPTVFVGGGTPTLLGAAGLTRVLDGVREHFDLADDAEVTTEANPDSVDESMLASLRDAGFTRISFGMQSSAPHVLAVLDRTHTPGASVAAAQAARRVGFEHVNLDLIYGTPGESDDDVRRSVGDALEAGVDHVSAYALIVEEGTPLARRVSRGDIAEPDDEAMAERYLLIDDLLSAAGFAWYELSNWSRPGGICRHNLVYWHDAEWWGVGPGAHSHVDGQRWWNVKHPRTYADRIAEGRSPAHDREVLSAEQVAMERLMLGLRLAGGVPVSQLRRPERAVPEVEAGLLDRRSFDEGRLTLTRAGRLLADRVIRNLA
jgi:putative oxygen-independent coproporphyrinogen III oxidase